MFEGCWWDGDLQREWLNSPGGSGWGTNLMVTKVLGDRLAEFSQEASWATHAATGTRPAFMGDIVGDLNRRRGQISSMDSDATGARIIKAFVPLAEQFGYVTVLRTLSSGRASSTMSFHHYSEVPPALAKDIIERSGYRVYTEE